MTQAQCGGRLKIIAAIEEPAVISRILTHLGLPARAPPRAPARRPELIEAVRASQEAADLSYELYDRGWKDFLNVLVSQRALYSSQDELVQSETAVITNLIALYKALGGGWEALDPDPGNG